MEVKFKKSFIKEFSYLPKGYQKKVDNIVETVRKCKTLTETQLDITQIENEWYRVRMGKYRIGVKYDGTTLFYCVMSRGDIYKHFPPK